MSAGGVVYGVGMTLGGSVVLRQMMLVQGGSGRGVAHCVCGRLRLMGASMRSVCACLVVGR